MATYFGGLNPIRINAAIAATTVTNATLYTVPGGCYADAVLYLRASSTINSANLGAYTISVGGVSIAAVANLGGNSVSTLPGVGVANASSGSITIFVGEVVAIFPLKIGPGHSVVTSGMTRITSSLVGTLFVNG